MPWKPKKPCRFPGCNRLTDKRYCEEHEKQVNKEYNKYKRNPMTSKWYGYRWRKIRKAVITKRPFCEMCLKEGRLTKAEEVHHIKPLRHGGNHEESNLMPLCKSCHSRITAEMGDRWEKKKY